MPGVYRIAAILVALVIGVVAGGNALSNASASSNPQQAAALSPYSSEAYRALALASITAAPDQMSVNTTQAVPFAREAYQRNGLDTEAAAILAMSQDTQEKRNASLGAINALSRRGRLLNFGLMQDAMAREDSDDALAALDRLMLLYTNVRSQLIPAMADYLRDERTFPAMAQILRNDPEWADSLFVSRGGGPETLANMARLRLELADSLTLDRATDRRLLQNLVTAGEWEQAFALYSMLEGPAGTQGEVSSEIDWAAEFAPFEWQLADDRAFHARVDRQGTSLDVRIDAGEGGDFATRMVPRPAGMSSLVIEHTMEPIAQLSDMSVKVTCVESGVELVDAEFSVSPMQVQLADDPCEWVQIVVGGRAWSGRRGLAGELLGVRFAR